LEPLGSIPQNSTFTFHFSEQEPYSVPGGTVKIIDSHTFPITRNISAALFTIEPGAMREMHWDTASDEWNDFIARQARLTVFDALTPDDVVARLPKTKPYVLPGVPNISQTNSTEEAG